MSELAITLLAYSLLLVSGLVILRVFVRRDYLRRGKLSAGTSILQALYFFVYGGFPSIYLADDWPAIHVQPAVRAAGLVLVVAGLGFLSAGVIRLGVPRSVGRGKKALQRAGLYAKSRNPQAIACGLYVLGFAMLWPSWQALGWALLYPVLIHVMILTEEEHLLRTHGQSYQAYCRAVPRYVRFLGA